VRALLSSRKPERAGNSGFRVSGVVAAIFLLGVVTPRPAAAAADGGAQAFEQGVQAFRAGDFPAALQGFLDARRDGLDTPGLHYDLGATYYKLQRYPEAEGEFQGLANDPEWAALALYNLGLIAQRSGREQQALEYFGRARDTATDGNLRALAGTALARLAGSLPPPPPRTSLAASLAGGYDSNVALTQDITAAGISHQADSFVEALASVSHRISGDATRGAYAYAGLLVRRYRDLTAFDMTGLRAGSSYETDSGRLQTSAGGYLETAYVGGGRFAETAAVDAQARRRLDAGGDLRGRYQFGLIRGGGGYEYLDGWEQRLTADAGFALAPWFVRVGYELELNNRRDLQQGTDFSSASPTRQSLFATAALGNYAGWQTDARGEYRFSRYNDPNVVSGAAVTRKDDRFGFALRTSRRLSGLWRAFVDYSYYRNQSNLDIYDYNRYQAMIGIEAAFEK
jgi:tetratricopeptide (TPR) repeat protein